MNSIDKGFKENAFHLAQQTDEETNEWIDANNLALFIKNAHKAGMELEFLVWFLSNYKRSGYVDGAIYHATREWDLGY